MVYEFYASQPVVVINSEEPQLEPATTDIPVLTINSPIKLLEFVVENLDADSFSEVTSLLDLYESLKYFGLSFSKLPAATVARIADTLYDNQEIYDKIVELSTDEAY